MIIQIDHSQLNALEQERNAWRVLTGVLAMKVGDGKTEVRISKADMNKVEGFRIEARGLKNGGFKLLIRRDTAEDEDD